MSDDILMALALVYTLGWKCDQLWNKHMGFDLSDEWVATIEAYDELSFDITDRLSGHIHRTRPFEIACVLKLFGL